MPNFDLLLPPETRAAAEEAWQRSQAQRSAQRSLGAASSLLDILNASVEEAKKKSKAGFNDLEKISNPEIRWAFEEAFKLSERLVGYLDLFDLSAPTPEHMISTGVNFQYLAEQFERMKQQEGATPHVVLAPHGLGKENWLTIARKMTTDRTIPNNPLKVHDGANGLRLGETDVPVTDDVWYSSDQAPTSTTTPGLDTLPVYQNEDNPNIKWTLRLISGRNKPEYTAMSYRESQRQTSPIQHQTIAEALTDKLTDILAGSKPTNGPIYWSLCWQPNPDVTENLAISSKVDYGLIQVTQRLTTFRYSRTCILSPIG